MKGEVKKRLESLGYTMTSWGKSIGLSHYDISLIIKINNGAYKGKKGRCKEIRELLLDHGFLEEEKNKCG